MNPQYPQQPGQMPPGYPGPAGPPQGPQGPYPPQPQPMNGTGPWQPQPGQMPPGPYPPQPPVPTPDYNPYAYPNEYGTASRKSKGPSKAIIIGGITLLLIIIVIAALAVGSGSQGTQNQTEPQSQSTNSNAGKDVVPRSDATLDLSSKININDTLKAQTIKAKTGEQVNLSSGFSFMVTKVEAYVSSNPQVKPADGKQFIVVTTVVGNRKQSGNVNVSYQDFRLRDASNQLLAPSAVTNEIINNKLASPSEMKPGEQQTGAVVYEVDADETAWVFKRTETYQKTTDDTTFNVEGEIAVQLATGATSTTGGDVTGGNSQNQTQPTQPGSNGATPLPATTDTTPTAPAAQ